MDPVAEALPDEEGVTEKLPDAEGDASEDVVADPLPVALEE